MLGTSLENSCQSEVNFDFDLEVKGCSFSSLRTPNPAEETMSGATDEQGVKVSPTTVQEDNNSMSVDEHQRVHAVATGLAEIVEVFDPEYKYVYQVPRSLITHMPQQNKQITRLMWCKNFLPDVNGDPHHSSCPSRRHCKYVHVNVASKDMLPHHSIHVNYIWRDTRECTYPTMPPGERFIVCCSKKSSVTAYFHVPSDRCLVTQGSQEARSPSREVLYYCVEFHITGLCREGENCPLVHVLTVDPMEVQKYKRATHITFASLLKQFYQPRNRNEERDGEGRKPPLPYAHQSSSAHVIPVPPMRISNVQEQFVGIPQVAAPQQPFVPQSIVHPQFMVPQVSPPFTPVPQLPMQYVQYMAPAQAQPQPLQWMVVPQPQIPQAGGGSFVMPAQGAQYYQHYATIPTNPFNASY